jgi:hypothetical protein
MKARRFVVLLVAVPLAAGGLSAGVAWAGAAAPAKVKAPAKMAKTKPFKRATHTPGGFCNKRDVAL